MLTLKGVVRDWCGAIDHGRQCWPRFSLSWSAPSGLSGSMPTPHSRGLRVRSS